MREHPVYRFFWVSVNTLLVVSLVLLVIGLVWEYSTRRYLQGFADAIVPLSADPVQKVEAILGWMEYGPARRASENPETLALRDPHTTLNYEQLLKVCGTATNAFVNLAASSGLDSRRLLLLGPDGQSKHVVAEVYLDGRWVVADPAFHRLFRDAQGRPVTRYQLQDPQVWQQATSVVPNYPTTYTYERTVHVRLTRIPYVGRLLRKTLDKIFPGWEEAFDWTLLLERESLAFTFGAAGLVLVGVAGRFLLGWYGRRRLGIARVRLRDQLWRAGKVLLHQSG
jgi:hypothetical protein